MATIVPPLRAEAASRASHERTDRYLVGTGLSPQSGEKQSAWLQKIGSLLRGVYTGGTNIPLKSVRPARLIDLSGVIYQPGPAGASGPEAAPDSRPGSADADF